MKKYFSEFLGTAMLVIFGCGSAAAVGEVIALGYDGTSLYMLTGLMIALAFGLGLIAVAYIFGQISGAHVNPAVSLAMLLNGRLSLVDFLGYVSSQLLGGIAGAALISLMLGSTENLGANGYEVNSMLVSNIWQSLTVEIILSFIFVLVVLTVTARKENSGNAGVIIGLTLAAVHILGIPFTGTSVNPARSFGPALLQGGEALEQVWIFFVGPLAGAILAAMVYMLFNGFPKYFAPETVSEDEKPEEIKIEIEK